MDFEKCCVLDVEDYQDSVRVREDTGCDNVVSCREVYVNLRDEAE